MAMVNMTARGSGGKQKQPAVNGMTGQPFPQQGGGQQLGNSQDMMGRGPMFANRLGGLAPQGGGQQQANQALFFPTSPEVRKDQYGNRMSADGKYASQMGRADGRFGGLDAQFSKAYGQGGPPPRLSNSYGGPQSMGTAPAFGGQQPQGFGGGQQLNSFRPYQMAQNGYGRAAQNGYGGAPQGNFGMMQGMGQQMNQLAGGMMQQNPMAQQRMMQGMGQGMAQPQMNAMQGFGQQMMQQPQFGNQPGQAMGSAGRFMQHLAQRNQPGQAMRGMQDQMLNQQAIAANGEPAVTDFFNQLMASPDYQGGPPPQQQAYR